MCSNLKTYVVTFKSIGTLYVAVITMSLVLRLTIKFFVS